MSDGEADGAPPAIEPAVRVIAMPADTNPYGDIFGGWLLGVMDAGGGSVASRHSRGRVATVAVEGMSFHRPVFVGDEVTVFAKVVATGRTSMRVAVEAWRRARDGEHSLKVTQAHFVFVAVDDDRRPRVVPALDGAG